MNSMLALNWLAGIILLAHAIWKLAAIVLAAVLLVLSSATGTDWWLAADDRGTAHVDQRAKP